MYTGEICLNVRIAILNPSKSCQHEQHCQSLRSPYQHLVNAMRFYAHSFLTGMVVDWKLICVLHALLVLPVKQ